MIFTNYEQLVEQLRIITLEEKEVQKIASQENSGLDGYHPNAFLGINDKKFILEEGIHTSVANENLLKEKLLINKKYRFNKMKDFHKHDYIEGIYVLEGEFIQIINGEEITMKAGDLCFMDSNTVHSFSYLDERTIVVNIMLTKDYFDGIFLELFADTNYITNFLANSLYSRNKERNYILFSIQEGSFSDMIMKNLLLEFFSVETRSNVTLKSLLIVLFTNLSREIAAYDEPTKEIQTEQDRQKKEMLAYINKHIKDINLNDMASYFNFHPTYLSSMIRKQFGRGLQDIIIERRLDKASNLLLSTQFSIEVVMEMVGYSNKSYFYKIFREKFEMTPNQFRQKNKI